jgi:hypothetical protein
MTSLYRTHKANGKRPITVVDLFAIPKSDLVDTIKHEDIAPGMDEGTKLIKPVGAMLTIHVSDEVKEDGT